MCYKASLVERVKDVTYVALLFLLCTVTSVLNKTSVYHVMRCTTVIPSDRHMSARLVDSLKT